MHLNNDKVFLRNVLLLLLFLLGSPYFIKVSDSSQSVVTGSSLRMTSLAQGAHFTIDTRGLENGECKVIVNGKCCAFLTLVED